MYTKMGNTDSATRNFTMATNSVFTNDSQEDTMDDSDAMQRLIYVTEAHIEPIIFIFGIITNFITFIIIRKMRISKVIKTILLALTVSDFLASLTGFLTIILEVIIFRGKMPYGIWLPGVVEIFTIYKLYLLFIGTSSALVILLAIVRSYSMLHPFEWTTKITYRRTVIAIISIIVITVVIFIPLLLYVMWKACFEYIENPEKDLEGDPDTCLAFAKAFPGAWAVRYYFFFVAVLLGPGTVISNLVCYIVLKRAINKSADSIREMQERRGSESSILGQQSSRNSRLNKMFLWVLFFNSICITPSFAQIVCLLIDPKLYLFDKTNPVVAIVDIVAEVFLGALPCYNFWTYLIVNKDFRRRYKTMCCCCCGGDAKEHSSNSKTPEPSPRPGRMYIGEPRGNQM